MQEERSWGRFGRTLAVATLWVGLARVLAEHGWRLLPLSLLRHLSLQGYLTAMQLMAALTGVAVAFLLLKEPREELAWRRPRWLLLGGTALLSPLAYVLSVAVAVSLALPLLKAEILARGVEQVQASSGMFGRELREAPVWMVLGWGVVISPVAEELVFRGPLWSALQRLVCLLHPRSKKAKEQSGLPSNLLHESPVLKVSRGLRRWLAQGGLATVLCAGIFAALHGGVPGAMGFIRVASAAGLGVACGQARHATGTVLGPIVLHVAYNLLAVGNARRWFIVEGWTKVRGVPWPVVHLAAVCMLAFIATAALRQVVLRKRSRET